MFKQRSQHHDTPNFATLTLLAAVPLAASEADTTGRGTGQSAATQGDMSAQFKQLDKNNDGQLSQSEAKGSSDLSSRFSAIDTDHDKKISVSEWQADQELRGAAGVSGESRDRDVTGGQSPSDTPKSGSEMNRTY